MSICAESCLSGMSQSEQTALLNRIRRKLGSPVVSTELMDENIIECICESIEEYSAYINNWVLQNRLGEMLGMSSEVDFTMKYVSNSLYFEKTFTKSIAEQAGLGADATRPLILASITLSSGTQHYEIQAGRSVNSILWYTPSFINLYGLDPFANTNIAFSEFGASFAGHTLYHVMPVFDTIMTAQAAELRNRVRGSEYSYILRPGQNGKKILSLYPIPNINTGSCGTGIGGGAGTMPILFYYYYDQPNYYGNPDYINNNANPGYTGNSYTQNIDGYQGNGLVSSPGDAQLHFISYSQLNSMSQTWVKKYAQALAKELLGLGIRGKFSGNLPIPDAELTLNSDQLISTSREDKVILKEELKAQLDALNYDAIMERRSKVQEEINKALGYGPMGLWLY